MCNNSQCFRNHNYAQFVIHELTHFTPPSQTRDEASYNDWYDPGNRGLEKGKWMAWKRAGMRAGGQRARY